MPKEVEVTVRSGWFRHFRVALTSAGGTAVVLALFTLLQRQPVEGFRLLGAWGPWPVVALVALGFFGHVMSRFADSLQTWGTSVVDSLHQGTEAQTKTADALSRLAEQGGRQQEEVRRLAIYAGREFPLIYDRFDKQDVVLKEIGDSMRSIHSRLNLCTKLRDDPPCETEGEG